MRYAIDILIVLMIAAMVSAVVMHRSRDAQHTDLQGQTVAALNQLHKELQVRFSIEEGDKSATGYPVFIQPNWFKPGPHPTNGLATEDQPWIDIAPPTDFDENPPDPVLAAGEQAGLWYNPNLGVFRARVPFKGTEQATLALYNAVNGTHLQSLPSALPASSPDRAPIAYRPEWAETMTASARTNEPLAAPIQAPPEPVADNTPSFFEQAMGIRRPQKETRSNEQLEQDANRPSLITRPSLLRTEDPSS